MDSTVTLMQTSMFRLMLIGILVAVAVSVVTHLLTTARRRHADANEIPTTDSHSTSKRLGTWIAGGLFAGLVVFGVLAMTLFVSFRPVAQPERASQAHNAFEQSHTDVVVVSRRATNVEITRMPTVTTVPEKSKPNPVAVVPEGESEDNVTTKEPEPKGEIAVPTSTTTVATEPKIALPKWITTGRVEDGDATLLVLSSRRFATVDQAKEEVLLAAANVVTEHFHKFEPAGAQWSVPSDMVQTHAVRQEYIEKQTRDFGRFTAPMYRVHLQLRLSPRLPDKFREPWQSFVVERRLWGLGSVFGLLTLLTATMTSYLRLDALTEGAYRRRLKLAAVSLIAAGGLVVWEILPNV